MSPKRRFGRGMETALALGLAVCAIHASLVPYGLDLHRAPAADLTFCLVAAWVIRRPGEAPLWAVLAIGLAADVFLSRPIGLGALALLLAAEGLRRNATWLRNGPFLFEWCAVALAFAAMIVGMRLALALVLLDPPPVGAFARHVIATVLAYPFVVAALNLLVGIRAARNGPAADRLGRVA